MLELLRTGDVVTMRELPSGRNRPRKVLLDGGELRLHAVFRDVAIDLPTGPRRHGKAYLGYRDQAIYEVAAYHLSRLLGLHCVPPTVERSIHGRPGSLQLWVEGAALALEHSRGRIAPPEPAAWSDQLQVMHLFDALIGNADRNHGNILIDRHWRLWLVDHTQAFVRSPVPLDLSRLVRCERGVWRRLGTLSDDELRSTLSPWLSPHELDCLVARRRALVELIQQWIDDRGAEAVLFDLPAPLARPVVWPWELAELSPVLAQHTFRAAAAR